MKTMRMTIIAVAVAMLAACGTNEKNYQKAYEKAKEKDTPGVENTIYNRIRDMAQDEKIMLDGDTVNVVKEYVTATQSAGFASGQLKRYNVIVGRFKQLFHAKSLCGRMVAGGYPQSIVVETGEPLYYVVALSTPSLREAINAADSLQLSSPVKLADGLPFILRASNR